MQVGADQPWVAAVVRVMPQSICGVGDPLGQQRERHGRSSSAGLHAPAPPSRSSAPSSRGGVPVFSRPSGKPEPVERLGQRRRPALADPAGRHRLLADMDLAAQEGAGGQHHRAARDAPRHRAVAPRRRAVRRLPGRRPRPRRSPGSRLRRERRLHRPAGRACGRPGPAGPRTAGPLLRLSSRNWIPAASAARPITPSSASISRTRWPLPRPPIAGLQRHRADGRELVRHQHRARAQPRGRGRRLAAGVAAADHDDVDDARWGCAWP